MEWIKSHGKLLAIIGAAVVAAVVLIVVLTGGNNGQSGGRNAAPATPTPEPTLNAAPATPTPEPTLYTSGDYTYRILGDGTAMIVGYSGIEEEITLPTELDGIRVTGVGMGPVGNSTVACVTIPNEITVTDGNPFRGWEALCDVRVADDHPTLRNEPYDYVLVTRADDCLICHPAMHEYRDVGIGTIHYDVSDRIRSIGAYAFSGSNLLVAAYCAGPIDVISPYAFENCLELYRFESRSGLRIISPHAFEGCVNLAAVAVGPDLTEIGDHAFTGCFKLSSISSGPDSYAAYTHAEFPASLRIIGDHAFDSCTLLKYLEFEEGLTTIGEYAFSSEPSSTPNVELPGTVTSISPTSFYFNCEMYVSGDENSALYRFCVEHFGHIMHDN